MNVKSGFVRINQKEQRQKKKDWIAAKSKRIKVECIVVTPADGTNYTDVVKLMKRQVDPEKGSVNVWKVQPTKIGDILIKFVEKSHESVEKPKIEIYGNQRLEKSELIQVRATVVMRDFDESVTVKDVIEAVKKKVSDNVGVHVNLSA